MHIILHKGNGGSSCLYQKKQLHIPAARYILSALAMLAMGYLSTQAFTTGMHWLVQSINSLVQLLAMAGHIALYRGLSPEAIGNGERGRVLLRFALAGEDRAF